MFKQKDSWNLRLYSRKELAFSPSMHIRTQVYLETCITVFQIPEDTQSLGHLFDMSCPLE